MYKLLYFIKAKTLINEKHEILKGAQNKLQIQLTMGTKSLHDQYTENTIFL